MMTELGSIQAVVHGIVQGVFFRAFVQRQANRLGLTGYVRNLPGRESVEVHAEGKKQKLEELIGYLKSGPPGAKIEKIETSWSEYSGSYPNFSIRY